MFFSNQSYISQNKYKRFLYLFCSFSKLFSLSDKYPYLHYRFLENVFCNVFGAVNISNLNVSVDAFKSTVGIGLKTFLLMGDENSSYEKIAEFNRDRDFIDKKKTLLDKVRFIALLRNKRLIDVCSNYGLSQESLLYHCVVRKKGELVIHEESMFGIDLSSVRIVSNGVRKNTVFFVDVKDSYVFNFAKSTLLKKFVVSLPIAIVKVNIINNPYKILCSKGVVSNSIYLPLYSYKNGKKYIYKRSGLNVWNASGRIRNVNEVYISVPKIVYIRYLDFFPEMGQSFKLYITSDKYLKAKICSDGNKALMTNPNADLGKWLLRDILKIPVGCIVTYQMLRNIGIDSVKIDKLSELNSYFLTISSLNSYESFKVMNLLNNVI
jgi:hypothetical protein